MSSLDELILFNSAFWREEGMLDGTKYAYMKKLAEHCRRAAGGNFPAGYYEPESMPYMLALRDACHPSGPLAVAGTRGRTFDIRERVPETTPLASVHIRLPGRKRYTELAYLFEYEGKERLVFKVTSSALVHVQLLVECFRRAGVLPQGFGLGWRDLACDNKSGKPLFMSDTNLVWRSPHQS